MLVRTFKRMNVVLDVLLWGVAVCLLVIAGSLQWMGDSGFQIASFYILVIAVLFFDAGVVAHGAFHFRRDMPLLLFMLVYNILLLGRVYFNCIYYRHRLLAALEADSWQDVYLAVSVVLIGLIVFTAVYYLVGPAFWGREAQLERGERSPERTVVPLLRQISRVAVYITAIPFFVILLIRAYGVLRNGYLSSFTQTNDLPGAITRLSTLFVPSFVVFLGTMPTLRQMRGPLAVYVIYMAASIFTGRRNMLVTEALMLAVYFFFRDAIRPKVRRRLNWKWAIPILLVGILGCYALQQMAYMRSGYVNWNRSIFSVLMSFMDSQGASFRVVMQTIKNQGAVWAVENPLAFLLYPFELFIRNNTVFSTLFGLTPIVEVQTTDFVRDTHNYAHWLTYQVDPMRYIRGGGFGTSFVAESYAACGVLGVIVVAAVLAVLFRWLSSLLTRNWLGIAVGLYMFRMLIYTPRNFAFSWITDTFSITNIVYVAALYMVSLLVMQIGTHLHRPDRPPPPRLTVRIRLRHTIGG